MVEGFLAQREGGALYGSTEPLCSMFIEVYRREGKLHLTITEAHGTLVPVRAGNYKKRGERTSLISLCSCFLDREIHRGADSELI